VKCTEALRNAVALHHRTIKIGMIHNPRPVAGLYLRVSNVQHQAVQVLEFLDRSGGDGEEPETVWMSVLRFVDTRRPGNGLQSATDVGDRVDAVSERGLSWRADINA
jgi:hypothetical protein